MLEEFKKFALKGNVLDLAVGVIIGGAFGKIVSSLVGDIMMPLIGLISGGVDFKNLMYTYNQTEIKYGMFIQTVVDFLIISISVFFFVRLINKLSFKKKEVEEAKPVVPTKEEALLIEIRDLLKEQVSNQKGIS
ncbi:large conductance mechanosensitive channel protein MscL [Bacillus sp. AFS055030]|uniref:large conductance mechanosensitive channel protein MscL n=1 Tax=Bacillus sp. AFS055030 TaxID=2033507 RepID=UPI000BFDF7D3|nr:large conductance mechanosensitive channel protein MscL [Bacillus sp. AFS055030]PGL70725.1 large conductance mechanosensitive channel protein MscL [Bacillus sp. AFS055030]